MTRISNVDQVLMLLRQQLQNLSKSAKSTKPQRADRSRAPLRQPPLQRISALAAMDDLSEDEVGTALIGAILAEEFGEAVANELKFQKVVSEVYRIISSDPEARQHLQSSLVQMRQAAGKSK